MKEFYGSVSFTGNAKFTNLKAKNKDEAKDKVFEEIEGIQLLLKDGSTITIDEIEWDLLNECGRGNISPPYLDDFEIEEEK